MDLLLRGGRDRPPALQHHPHAQERLLPGQVGVPKNVRTNKQGQKGAFKNGTTITSQYWQMHIIYHYSPKLLG